MIATFFAIIGGLALTGFMLWDMARKRQQMTAILDRIEPMIKKNQSMRLRAQNLRRLSLSMFFNGQLLDGLEREIQNLEKEFSVPESAELVAAQLSTFIQKRLKALEERAANVEQVVEQQQQAAQRKDEADAEADAGGPQPAPDQDSEPEAQGPG